MKNMRYENWIDVTKGIGILLVILGHNNFDQFFLTIIHTFNMPLFFLSVVICIIIQNTRKIQIILSF